MRNKLIVLAMLGLTAAAGISSYFGRVWVAEALDNGPFHIEIAAQLVLLDPENSGSQSVGALTYVRGWSLSSESDDFGGFSGLVVSDDGTSLVAINDKGDWLTADMALGSKKPLQKALIYPFEKGAHGDLKSAYDAESLLQLNDGFLVGFEQEHRILEVGAVGGNNSVSAFGAQADLGSLADNGGIEAMTFLADGRLLMFGEKGLDQQGTLPVWLASKTSGTSLRFKPPFNFSPTDAATLPNGDVLLLTRYYSAFDGVSAKILRIAADDIKEGAVLQGEEIAHFSPSMTVDNMEALDLRQLADGTIRLYIMSDDNFRSAQRTLLMIFDWQPEHTLVMKVYEKAATNR
jgi:hypothetical protein